MLLANSIRHTRPRQLLRRAALIVKRRTLQLAASRGAAPGAEGHAPERSGPQPEPIFAPRKNLVEADGSGYNALLLNTPRSLRTPIDWHPPELERGTRLAKLNLHYMEYLEGVSDDVFADVVTDWMSANPPYRPGYWLDNWNSYALSIRCVVWMQELARRGERVPLATRARMEASLAQQLRFLVANLETDIGGNHILKNIKALLWAGCYFSGPEPREWARAGAALLERELHEQILDDGMHFERSPAYHAQTFADVLECHHVCDEPLRGRTAGVLARMAQALADLTHPDGLVSLFNDGGLGMTYHPAELLAAYETRMSTSAPTPRAVAVLPDAGYYAVRHKDSLVVVDCGPVGPDHLPAHAHGDVLAFEWTVRGLRLAVDAGVFEYDPGEWRTYARSTRSHNTVTIDDADQAEFWGAFRVARRPRVRVVRLATGPGSFDLTGEHDGYSRLPGNPVHRRRIRATPESLQVEDLVAGGAGQPVRARILLHPECIAAVDSDGVVIRRGQLAVRLRTAAPCAVAAAWWLPDFGERVNTSQVVLDYGAAPVAGEFALSLVEGTGSAS